jgi:alpha-glucan phosphorylase-like protein
MSMEKAKLRSFEVVSPLPESQRKFLELARKNIAWSWNQELMNAFQDLDPVTWHESDHNPLSFLTSLSLETLTKAREDSHFKNTVLAATLDLEVLQAQSVTKDIAYFCMEFGMTNCLRLYSGGLGVLAGDHLKTASDLRLPLCAVGLAYKHGYFQQRLDHEGRQVSKVTNNDFEKLPMEAVLDASGKRLKVHVAFPGRQVTLQAWKVGVGAVSLFLLDSDCAENTPEDRMITDHLYGGDSPHRLKQEILLGVGGYWMLKAMSVAPKVFHMNEGHAAFLVWARMIDLMQEGKLCYADALEYIYQTNIFTTHTPVPAGHDVFADELMQPYLETYGSLMKTPLEEMSRMGKLSEGHSKTVYSMTDLALYGSSFVNGVSQVHGEVSRKMFHSLYPAFDVSEVPVRGITNGVHLGTWLAQEWQQLFDREVGIDWRLKDKRDALSSTLGKISDEKLWATHLDLKRRLIKSVKEHVSVTYAARGESPAALAAAMTQLNERALFIGFARRFAPYKRATLLFQQIERLEALIHSGHPIVILYAGKAHPHDKQGQEFIRQIIELSRKPSLQGRVLFIENYELDVARHLVQGCDVWLNTPTRPLEASGTSGMKAAINGCLNLSVDDGWWSECANGKNGWLISDRRLSEDLDFQLQYDSAQIYSLLETEVVPAFFDRNAEGVPESWVARMRESMLTTLWDFSTARMLADYERNFLKPALQNAAELSKDSFSRLKSLTELKKRLLGTWDQLSVDDVKIQGLDNSAPLQAGQPVSVRASLRHPGLQAHELVLQAVVSRADSKDGKPKHFRTFDLKPKSPGSETSEWEGSFSLSQPGSFSLGLRALPLLEAPEARTRVFMQLSKWY